MATGFMLSQVFDFLFAVVGFIVAITITAKNGWRCPKAARMVWFALGLKAFSFIGATLLMVAFAQFWSPSSIGVLSAIIQTLRGLLGMLVLILFVRAAFVDREPPHGEPTISGSVPAGDENPYAAPR